MIAFHNSQTDTNVAISRCRRKCKVITARMYMSLINLMHAASSWLTVTGLGHSIDAK